MRDLNFFIKNIEKDLTEKFSKMNIKDFNQHADNSNFNIEEGWRLDESTRNEKGS
jgi:hypothetical protein